MTFQTQALGTSIYVANNNTITKNNYINNIEQLPSGEWEWYAKTFGYNGSQNIINQNYWNDYNGTDSNGDGLGDTPYIINEDNQDNNPLMAPIAIEVIPEFPSLTTLRISGLFATFMIWIICKQRIKERGKKLNFNPKTQKTALFKEILKRLITKPTDHNYEMLEMWSQLEKGTSN